MINCNPETVSTDYDTSDRLYFEPLTLEDVLGVVEVEQPEGVIVQFGGQTPLKLAAGLQDAGVPLLGTSVDAIDLAEDRGRFGALLDAPRATRRRRTRPRTRSTRRSPRASGVGFPLLVRPSYVLGGRAMEIVYSRDGLARLPARATRGRRRRQRDLPRPLPRERDRGRRRRALRRRGRLDRRDHAARRGGRHPLGRQRLRAAAALARPRDARPRSASTRRAIALGLGVVGLINVQYAVHERRALRDRGQPARVADRAVRLQGDRRAAGQDGLPDHARRADRRPRPARRADARRPRLGQGGGAAVRPLRRRRRAARPGDALDRRGHGHRARLPDGVRQGAGRGRRVAAAERAPCSSPSPTATRPAPSAIAQTLHDLGFRIVATRGHGGGDRRMGVPGRARSTRSARARRTSSTGSSAATSTSSSTRRPARARAPTAGRSAARRSRAAIPCLTTLSGGLAAARAIAAARQAARPRCSRCRSCTAAPARGPRRRGSVRSDGRGALAPFGRRALTVRERRERRRLRRARRRLTPTAPLPQPGQFYMLAAVERWGGGDDERPFLPRAFSVLRAGGGRLEFLLEDVGPGTERLCELGAGRRAVGARAARARLRAAAGGARARCCAAAASASRRSRSGRTSCSRAGRPAPALLGFRDAAHAEGAALLRQPARGHRRRLRRPPRPRHRPARRGARRRRRTRSSTPAGRRRCSRPSARCARSAAYPPSSRSRPGWRAASARASAASCRCARGGYVRAVRRRARCSTREPLADRTGARRRERSTLLRARARAPDRQRLGHLRRDRRPARVRRRARSSASRSAPSCRRRSRSSRAPATRRRGCTRRRPG